MSTSEVGRFYPAVRLASASRPVRVTPAMLAEAPRKQQHQQQTKKPLFGGKRNSWKPGQSGNARGRSPLIVTLLKRIPPELGEKAKELAAFILDDPNYRTNVIERIMRGKAQQLEILLWHYRYGPPAQTIRHEGDVGIDFAKVLKQAWDALQTAGDPRLPKPLGPAPTMIDVLPQGTVPTNGRRDGRVYVALQDQEDDDEELWPEDSS